MTSPVEQLVQVMDQLRSPGGCPWDAEQTHESLARYLLEETYEALEAMDQGDLGSLREELGDLLLQVVFHARIAQESDPTFSLDAIAQGVVDKLVRRHPHVFTDLVVTTNEELEANNVFTYYDRICFVVSVSVWRKTSWNVNTCNTFLT